jgi:hypothetical protein
VAAVGLPVHEVRHSSRLACMLCVAEAACMLCKCSSVMVCMQAAAVGLPVHEVRHTV